MPQDNKKKKLNAPSLPQGWTQEMMNNYLQGAKDVQAQIHTPQQYNTDRIFKSQKDIYKYLGTPQNRNNPLAKSLIKGRVDLGKSNPVDNSGVTHNYVYDKANPQNRFEFMTPDSMNAGAEISKMIHPGLYPEPLGQQPIEMHRRGGKIKKRHNTSSLASLSDHSVNNMYSDPTSQNGVMFGNGGFIPHNANTGRVVTSIPMMSFGGNTNKYQHGSIHDVSEEEANKLKQLGYEFEVI